MGKYTKKRRKGQYQPKNSKKRSPSDPPIWVGLIAFAEFLLLFFTTVKDGESLISVIVITFVTYIIMIILWKIWYRTQLAGATIHKIDRMTGEEFEDYLAILYRKHGFEVKMTPKTCDFGADLLLTDKRTGKKICVQAKRYRGLVGEAAVQQTLSGREYYSCDEAMIITNSHYTDAAKSLAKKCGIKMIDRFSLGKEQMFLF